jgi:hypothetical protein
VIQWRYEDKNGIRNGKHSEGIFRYSSRVFQGDVKKSALKKKLLNKKIRKEIPKEHKNYIAQGLKYSYY